MTAGAPGRVPRLDGLLDEWMQTHRDELIAFRRDLHAHPEPSGREHRTTDAVVESMRRAGYSIRPLSVGTGAICDPTWSRPPRLAVRADLDALAMSDLKDVPYRSRTAGVAHTCGHDVHTTVALGAALFLADHPSLDTAGTRFVFQPSEERVPGGALDVLADDGLDGIDAVIGVHCEPKLDVGRIGVREGAITSAADMATIRIGGPGGHTARPELTVDTIRLAAEVVTEVPRIVDEAAGSDRVKVVFGAIHGGDAANAVPTAVELRASVRTPSIEVWEGLEPVVRSAVIAICAPYGADVDVDYVRGVPPTVNDTDVVALVRAAAIAVVGAGNVVESEQSWGGDDFAWLARERPGAYVRLGVRALDGPTLDLHAGHFDVDERAIDVGVRLYVHAAARTGVATSGRDDLERDQRPGR